MARIEKCWYLAQLRPQSHQVALRNLDRQGFETFLPRIELTRRHGTGFSTRAQPLFPGYIFIEFDVLRDDWHKINSTSGVSRIVSFGGRPALVPKEIITSLLARADQNGLISSASTTEVGSEVKLLTGPFADFVAKVDVIEPDRRVWMLIEILGRTTKVCVEGGGWQET